MQEVKEKSYLGWGVCRDCKNMYHIAELNQDLQVCPNCDFHFTLNADQRIDLIADGESFEELFADVVPNDVLEFIDSKPYKTRLEQTEARTKSPSAVKTGVCTVTDEKIALGVMDFAFMGGSMGRCEGEKITLLFEYATKNDLPIVMINASGGARMQESMFSLMQMAKTSQAVKQHQDKGLFYLSVLTNPTMGGVLASFASLADVILAEPKALIGFAGPRVIEQTIGEKLKPTDQRSEFQLEAGMIDQIVNRKDLKEKITYFVRMFRNTKNEG